MKKFLTFVIVIFLMAIGFSFILPINYDIGIKVVRTEDYTIATFRYPFYTDTYVLEGEFPHADEVRQIKHKQFDEYNNLNNFEKIIYDSILNRAYDIFDQKTTSLAVKVPLKDAGLEENISTLNEETVELINNTDFVKIFLALHKDYQWLFWFEENMTWSFRGPDVTLTDEGVDGTFEIILKPVEMFDNGEEGLNSQAVSLLQNIEKDKLVFDSIPSIEKHVLNKISYAYDEVNEIKFGTASEEVKVNTKSIMNFLNEENPEMLCSGYSNAFQMLCDLNDFECYTRKGELIEGNNVENHSWSIYYNENGERILSDLTNSDSGSVGYKGELLNKKISDSDSYEVDVDGTMLRYIEK